MKNILRIMLLFLLGLAMVAVFPLPVSADYSETIVHPKYPGFTLTYTISGVSITDIRRGAVQGYSEGVNLLGTVRQGDTITIRVRVTTPPSLVPTAEKDLFNVCESSFVVAKVGQDEARKEIPPGGSAEVTASLKVESTDTSGLNVLADLFVEQRPAYGRNVGRLLVFGSFEPEHPTRNPLPVIAAIIAIAGLIGAGLHLRGRRGGGGGSAGTQTLEQPPELPPALIESSVTDPCLQGGPGDNYGVEFVSSDHCP